MSHTALTHQLQHFIQQFPFKVDLFNCPQLYLAPHIPFKKIKGAQSYLPQAMIPDEMVLLLDDTLFGSAKIGLCMTDHAIFHKVDFENTRVYFFKEIQHVECQWGVLTHSIILNRQHELNLTQPDKRSMQVLADLIRDYAKYTQATSSPEEESYQQQIKVSDRMKAVIHYYCYLGLSQGQGWNAQSLQWVRQIFSRQQAQVQAYLEAQLLRKASHTYAQVMGDLFRAEAELEAVARLLLLEYAIQLMLLNAFSDSALQQHVDDLQRVLHLSDTAVAEVIERFTQHFSQMRTETRNEYSHPKHYPTEVIQACQLLSLNPEQLSPDWVKQAYRKKIAEFHPDQYQHLAEAVRQLIEQQAQQINGAREILLDFLAQ